MLHWHKLNFFLVNIHDLIEYLKKNVYTLFIIAMDSREPLMVTEKIKYKFPWKTLSNSNLSNNKGFTLIELLVVCAIIAVIASMALTAFGTFREQTRVARCIGEINGLEKDLGAYAVDKGTYPPENTWLTEIGREGLLDPWGNPYVYKPFTPLQMRKVVAELNSDYDLYSKGANGVSVLDITNDPISSDDIIRATDGSYIGLASKF